MPKTTLATRLFQMMTGLGLDVRPRRSSLSNDSRNTTTTTARIRSLDRVARWESMESRMGRYAFLSAMADNTAYADKMHGWSQNMKYDFELSPSTKPVFNPFGRIREFWATHIYSGTLDPEVGDGKTRPTSVPIETKQEALRAPIGLILNESRWDIFQTVYGRTGAGLGDVGLFSVNDTINRRCYIEVIHPESILKYQENSLGEPIYYLLREWRDDPRPNALTFSDGSMHRVAYIEEGYVEDGQCHFRTFLGDGSISLHSWDDNQGSEWTEDYPFLPLELVAHIRPLPKSPYGDAEAAGIVAKIMENDDIATLVNEAIRKYVDPVWLFSGVRRDSVTLTPDEGKDVLPSMFSTDPAARAQALVATIPFADITAIMDRHKKEIIDDKPELDKEIDNATGDPSGVALRNYQQRLTTKGQTRRAGYDSALSSAIKRCIRMAGMEGYDGFQDFDPDRLTSDPTLLQFRIAERALFRRDELDQLIVEEKEAAIAESWDRAGFPIEGYAESRNWAPERLQSLKKSRKDALDAGLPVGRAKQAPVKGDAAAAAVQAPGGAAPSL